MNKPLYSVTGLVRYIKGALDSDKNLQSILVKGEISNFTNHRSGHWYFTLKDAKAKISCVMFASYASRCKMLPKEGMKVLISANVSLYEAGGSTQLYVTAIQVDGLGDLYLQLEALKEKMRTEGCFALDRKRALPDFPMRIGVITAKTGAAIQDILTTISRRWPICEVQVYPSLVQGASAAKHIVENLKKADEDGHDVLLLARGGGAIEDLWCFNEEIVARQILQMKTVIVTGVGHETDTTLVDYVSDARAATPTAAAELITPEIHEVRGMLSEYKNRMVQGMKHEVTTLSQQLSYIKSNRYLKDPLSYIQKEQMDLAMHVKNLSGVEKRITNEKEQLTLLSHSLAMYAKHMANENEKEVIALKERVLQGMKQYQTLQDKNYKTMLSLLDAYSPLKILGRGYAITFKEDNVVKSIKDIADKDTIKVRLQDGFLHAAVIEKEEFS